MIDRKSGTLKYTSSLNADEFVQKCSAVDYWYHSYYFDNGISHPGIFDIGRDIDNYSFPENLQGVSVLDVGPAGGWFSIYFAQQGADVVSYDVRGYCDYDIYGRFQLPGIETEKERPDFTVDGRPIYISPAGEAFWLIKDLLGYDIDHYNGRVYDLHPDLFGGRTFDLVFVGAVLMHLRDPVRALQALRRICSNKIIVSMYCDPNLNPAEPSMALRNWTNILWWVPNQLCLEQWFKAAGFATVDISPGVKLTADRPFIDSDGTSHGNDQHLWRIEASV